MLCARPAAVRSMMLPARMATPSSRAQPEAAATEGPSSGSAPSAVRGPWMKGHFSGSTTRRAPAAAARLTRACARAVLASRSAPLVIWTAATVSRSLPSP